MYYLKKYFVIFALLGLSFIIVLTHWGSGRFIIIISAAIASLGYYLIVHARDGKRLAGSVINDSSSVHEGFSKLKGKVKIKDDLYSYLGNDPVVFYEVLVEKGTIDYDSPGSSRYNGMNQQDVKTIFSGAKWHTIKRKSEWNDFYIETESGVKLLVKDPEKASGQWIFTKDTLPQINIETYEESSQKIKDLFDEKEKEKIEGKRYIRHVERTIKSGDQVVIYGSVEVLKDEQSARYIVSNSESGYFVITNDPSYDLLYDEKKQYNVGITIFVLGVAGMIISYFWPIAINLAMNS